MFCGKYNKFQYQDFDEASHSGIQAKTKIIYVQWDYAPGLSVPQIYDPTSLHSPYAVMVPT